MHCCAGQCGAVHRWMRVSLDVVFAHVSLIAAFQSRTAQYDHPVTDVILGVNSSHPGVKGSLFNL